ncbi:MAG TPA: hypothetical protein VF117_03655 [Gammaproteobacteria bacterium]
MSRTKSRHPVPADGKGKQPDKHLKRVKRARDIRDEPVGQANRIYGEDFMPPRTWHNDA